MAFGPATLKSLRRICAASAFVAQGIEHWLPKPCAQVRILPRAPKIIFTDLSHSLPTLRHRWRRSSSVCQLQESRCQSVGARTPPVGCAGGSPPPRSLSVPRSQRSSDGPNATRLRLKTPLRRNQRRFRRPLLLLNYQRWLRRLPCRPAPAPPRPPRQLRPQHSNQRHANKQRRGAHPTCQSPSQNPYRWPCRPCALEE